MKCGSSHDRNKVLDTLKLYFPDTYQEVLISLATKLVDIYPQVDELRILKCQKETTN